MTKPLFLFSILLTPLFLSAQGYFYSEGTVTVQASASIEIKGNTQLEEEVFGNGTVILNGDNPQTLSGADVKMNNLKITNSADVFLGNNLFVHDSLIMTSGVIYLQDFDVQMADNLFHTGNSIGYIITNGTGRIYRKIDTNPFTFHVGYGSEYFPFSVTEMGVADTFSLAGWDFLPDDGTSNGTAINSHVALLGYNLQDAHAGGNTLDLQMQWRDSKNAGDFVQEYAIGISYNVTEYEELDDCPTNVNTMNPNVIAYSGIHRTGTFGIGDSVYLTNIPHAVIHPGDTSVCNGSSVLFSAFPSNADAYTWNTGDTSLTITTGTAGTYYVDITDSTGCIYRSNEATLTLLGLPNVPSIGQTGNLLSVPSGYSSYQWFLNGDSINGATSNSYNAAFNGTYSVIVTGPTGCSVSSSGYPFINLGIDPFSSSSFHVIGSDDQIYIINTSGALYRIQVLDILGRLLYSGKVNGGNVSMPVATGIYVVNIYTEHATFSQKVLIR